MGKTVGSVVGEGIDNTFGAIGNVVKGAGKALSTADDVAAGVVGYTLDTGASAVKGVASAGSAVVSGAEKGVSAVASGASGLVSGATSAVSNGVSNLQERGAELKTGTIIKGNKADSKVESSFQQNKDTIKSNMAGSSADMSLQKASAKAVEL